jgi:hypothetical protein
MGQSESKKPLEPFGAQGFVSLDLLLLKQLAPDAWIEAPIGKPIKEVTETHGSLFLVQFAANRK